MTAASNSNQKIREYSSEIVNTKQFEQNIMNGQKQTLYLNRRESQKVKPKESQTNTISAISFPNSRLIFNNSDQNSVDKIRNRNCIPNLVGYQKAVNIFKPDKKRIPYILQKRNSNSPFILKGQNFSSEEILPPNFGLEDVFLRNELKQKLKMQGAVNHQNRNLIQDEAQNKASSYVRYFHTSDGARNRNANYNSSSLDPYHDSPPYIQHSGSSDFLGT